MTPQGSQISSPTSAQPSTDTPVGRNVDAAIAARARHAAQGLSYGRIGRMTGTHPETVRRYLGGRTRIPAAFAAELARSLGIPTDALLYGELSQGDPSPRTECAEETDGQPG